MNFKHKFQGNKNLFRDWLIKIENAVLLAWFGVELTRYRIFNFDTISIRYRYFGRMGDGVGGHRGSAPPLVEHIPS